MDASYERTVEQSSFEDISALGIYFEMPIHKIPALVTNKVPIVMVVDGSNVIVLFEVNDALLEKAYRDTGAEIKVYCKPVLNLVMTH